MIMRWIAVVGIVCWVQWTVVAAADISSAPLNVYQVTAPDKTAWVQLFGMGLDVPEQRSGLKVTIIGTSAEKLWLEAQGYEVQTLINSASRHYANRALAAGASTMGGFRTLSEIWDAVDSVISDYPGIVSSKINIGMTGEGRSIYAIRMSDNPNTDEGSEPAILFTGLHHAREPIGPHLLLYTMQEMAANYGTDPVITELINEREIWFIPIVNPDGYAFNEATDPGGGGLWRKNRRVNGGGAFGVDPNRNYGYQWGLDDFGSSADSTRETYRGPGPFSEPETRAVRDFCIAHPNLRIAFNYHAYSNLLLYPWGYVKEYAPDHQLFAAIADSATSFNGYAPGPGWGLYLTNGDADDHMYGALGILSFTPEVGTPADWFWPDPGRITPLTLENYPANLFVIDICDAPEKLLPAMAPVWDSIFLAGTDSLTFVWSNEDTTVNSPVNYDVVELFGAQVVQDDLESGSSAWDLLSFTRSSAEAFSGTYSLYSGAANNSTALATQSEPYVVLPGDTMRFFINFDIEDGWDYGYVEISTDGGLIYTTIPGTITTNSNPRGNNIGNGITGTSTGWTFASFDLGSFVGQEVVIRFAYRTDQAVLNVGMYIDNISPVQLFDSAVTIFSTSATLATRDGYPDGDYFFRIVAEDPEGDLTSSLTRFFSYSTEPEFTVGDVNVSGTITSADVIYLVNFVFKAGPTPLPVEAAGNVNGLGDITSADIIYLVNFVFKGGPPPVQP